MIGDLINHTSEIKENPEEFIFTIESWGQLSPKDILQQVADGFDETMEAFTKAL